MENTNPMDGIEMGRFVNLGKYTKLNFGFKFKKIVLCSHFNCFFAEIPVKIG